MISPPARAGGWRSRSAVAAIGSALSLELRGSGVSYTTILPGYVESEIGRVDSTGVFRPEQRDRMPAALKWPAERAARVIPVAARDFARPASNDPGGGDDGAGGSLLREMGRRRSVRHFSPDPVPRELIESRSALPGRRSST